MNWRQIFTVYRKELKDTLRDRRTIISMFVVPILVIPGFSIGIGMLSAMMARSALKEAPAVMVVGGADSPQVVAALKASPHMRVAPYATDYAQRIADKSLRAAVEIPPDFDATLRDKGAPPRVTIYDYTGEFRSENAATALESFFNTYRDTIVKERLAKQNLPGDYTRVLEVAKKNVAPPSRIGGVILGGFVPYLLIILCIMGAMYPALDLTAGEKERGTMETILCSPVGRTELVLGKFFLVMTTSLTTVLCTLAAYALCAFILLKVLAGQIPGDKIAQITEILRASIPGVACVCALILPLAVLFSALLLVIALFAKSFKEAQSYVQPLIIVAVIAASMGLMPGLELNARTALIPLINVALVCKEVVSGSFPLGMMALIFVSTCVYAAIALRAAVVMFKRENVIFRT